ncbi:sugar hydrolase [Clostridioides difficile]|nr:sugar hydrolase [uncultured Clostridioides sp.]EGT5420616.1 sugar hydrolase [Clostridioides difficile]MBH7488602.1 sugar hydrolase [Clostridioides difficile]MBY1671481.1 sugar hydrolase [Clostridioides difficile]MBY1792992.1 sugar hydrolase [Clostridioides difficile]MBY1997094.1 sugar hydrolase [Clostridioides difficile]
MSSITNSIKDFKMEINQDFINKAERLKPALIEKLVKPKKIINIKMGKNDWKVIDTKSIDEISNISLGKGDSICIDFGNHQVGYVSFKIKPIGSPPDAPAHLKIKLGETLCEIGEDSSTYNGGISSSWIQEETMHIDILPDEINMKRRYAFRYLEIKVLDTSPKYKVIIENVYCNFVSSVDMSEVDYLSNIDDDLIQIDKIALKTMQDCMQTVFEDGPKRDRRLWIGDLRLQAITNYETFKNNDLVKRCLYLFAGLTQNKGQVGACLFIEPKLLVDDTALFDYSLFFISCLHDYYEATKDMEVLRELWAVAYLQAKLALERVGTNDVVYDSDDWWCFLDWNEGLNKQAGAQGVLIYTLKQAHRLAIVLGDSEKKEELEYEINRVVQGAKNHLWDEKQGFFVSGSEKQVSWISQIWCILADVFDKETNTKILDNLLDNPPAIDIVTPYAYHHLVECLILNNRREKALECIRGYWGEMVKDGADCFWELYNPNDKFVSPYGSRIINSYCHAWSCTPSYFIRKYFV